MPVSTQDVVRWVDALQQVFAENREMLTNLDSAARRRRLWRQHGPRLYCGTGGAVRSPSAGSPLRFSERVDCPHPHDGRLLRAPPRHIFPPRRSGLRGQVRARARRRGGAVPGRRRRPPTARQSRRPATRPCWTPGFPHWMPCDVPWRMEAVWRKSWNGARRRLKQACGRPFPCRRARAEPAIWETAALDTRTPARPGLTCC